MFQSQVCHTHFCSHRPGRGLVPWPHLTARQTWKYVSSHVPSYMSITTEENKNGILVDCCSLSHINHHRTPFIEEKSKVEKTCLKSHNQ